MSFRGDYVCRCGKVFEYKEEREKHWPSCKAMRNSPEKVAENMMKSVIRQRLLRHGAYTEKEVTRLYSKFSVDTDFLLSFLEMTKVQKLKAIDERIAVNKLCLSSKYGVFARKEKL